MHSYLNILEKILREGVKKPTRTGIPTLSISGVMFEHDMSEGFPILTTRKMPFKGSRVETEGFIQGVTDKLWYQERGCHFWDHWCNKKKVPYRIDAETKKRMREERDLGPIYGFQWRHFGAEYRGFDFDYSGNGKDQLAWAIERLKKDLTDRKIVISAWNPIDLDEMALEPCHYSWQILVAGGKIDLLWNQRSVDTPIGLPNNITQYATILHLVAKELRLQEGRLVGMLGDTHIYENQIEGVNEQLKREPHPLPRIQTNNFTSIFNWKHDQTKLVDYQSHPKIDFGEIAV